MRRRILLFALTGCSLGAPTFLRLITATAADDAKPVPPPQGATVLFDGKSTDNWARAWKILEDGSMEVRGGSNNTKQAFGGDFHLHVEFWLPLMANRTGQGRANSGVFPQGDLFEIQVLDSYMNETYKAGGCAAIYGQKDPDNFEKAVRKPEEWQTYDIHFKCARFEDGKLKTKARVTVFWNGVKVHDDIEIAKEPGDDKPQRIELQDHGCRVRYRDIWLAPKEAK